MENDDILCCLLLCIIFMILHDNQAKRLRTSTADKLALSASSKYTHSFKLFADDRLN